jgi:hypothetical protein
MGRTSWIVPRDRGVRGAATALSGPRHPKRVSPRGTRKKVPRVGLLASRAVVGGALNAGLAWLERLQMLI